MTFEELGLQSTLVTPLTTKGIVQATSIQAEVFSPILNSKSVLALSKTGTGKTLAYLAPLAQKYFFAEELRGLKVIVMVPTRELASQVADTFQTLSQGTKQIAVIVGGESEEQQSQDVQKAQFLVATPGRLLDLLRRRRIATDFVDVVVFDEADRLLDMGFIDDIHAILKLLPKKIQMLFFSATLHYGVEEVAYELGIEFERYGVAEEKITVEGLNHEVSFVGDEEKFHALSNFLYDRKEQRGIVFSNYRDRAHAICARLKGLGCLADALSAQLSQGQRNHIIESYRSGKTKVLIASDLAARGLDFIDVEYVVNFDLPEDPSTYVHRVGRTARAGKSGNALSFVGYEDAYRLEKLESYLGQKIGRASFEVEKLSGKLPRFSDRPQPAPSQPRPQSAPSGPRPQSQPSRPRTQAAAAPKSPVAAPLPKAATKPLSFWQKILKFLGLSTPATSLAKAAAPHAAKPQEGARMPSSDRPRGNNNRNRHQGGGGRSGRGGRRPGGRDSGPRGPRRPAS